MAPTLRELLVAQGVVAEADLDRIESAAQLAGRDLCDHLLASGAVEERALAAVLAERHGLPGIDLSRSSLAREALDLVPRVVAESDGILPLSLEGGRIHVAVTPATDSARTLGEVRFVTGLEVSPYVAVGEALRRVVPAAYQAAEAGAPEWRGPAAPPEGGLALQVPISPTLPEGDEALEEVEELNPVEAPVPASRPVGERARVLVVDDEPEIRGLVSKGLSSRGYEVEVAVDGADGLARATANPPALVLLDAMLPRLHGFEVARRLRADPRTRAVPIVMMTAIYRGWRFAQDARETYGAQDYVEKPFRMDDLARRVAAAMRAQPNATPASSVAPLVEQARQFVRSGKLDEAVEVLEEALRGDPFSAEAHQELARARKQQGDDFGAMTALERVVELRPDAFRTLRSLAALYAEKGFRRKAAEVLERALGAAPDPAAREGVRADLLRLLEG